MRKPVFVNEIQWDKKLKIHTVGRDASHADDYHHPYEPTPYTVLQRLAESGYIDRENIVVDYGCGKGRVGFYLNREIGCRIIGLEYDEKIYRQAAENLECFGKKQGVEFLCMSAEDYEIRDADCYYFFNPFPVEIFRAVMKRIMKSYYESPRVMRLFFYYPSDEYISCLMTGDSQGYWDEVNFLDEIDCGDLFAGKDERERIMIFEIGS